MVAVNWALYWMLARRKMAERVRQGRKEAGPYAWMGNLLDDLMTTRGTCAAAARAIFALISYAPVMQQTGRILSTETFMNSCHQTSTPLTLCMGDSRKSSKKQSPGLSTPFPAIFWRLSNFSFFGSFHIKIGILVQVFPGEQMLLAHHAKRPTISAWWQRHTWVNSLSESSRVLGIGLSSVAGTVISRSCVWRIRVPMDSRIVRRGIISSCQSAAASETVNGKAFNSDHESDSCKKQRAVASTCILTFAVTQPRCTSKTADRRTEKKEERK